MSDHEKTVHDLEAKYAAVQATISTNLKQGKPTLDARRELAELHSQLTTARNAAAAHAALERAEAHGRATAAGRTAAAGSVVGIEASISHLAAAASPDMSTAPLHPAHAMAIEQAASELALAESRHADASQLHINARAEVTEVEGRLAEAQSKHDAIIAERREGNQSDSQEAKIYALSTDIVDLRGMLSSVSAAAASLTATDTARAVADARKALDRAHAEARASLLADHVTLLSRTLEAALYECEAAGKLAGKSLHVLWKPSPVLRHALSMGQLPALHRQYGG